jgi:transposase
MDKIPININNLVSLYESGLSIVKISKQFAISKSHCYKLIASTGTSFRGNKIHFSESDAIADYVAGMSENQVAIKYSVQRSSIKTILERKAIHRRSQSEAEFLKWQSMTGEQRSQQVCHANQAIRDKPPEFHARSAILQAKTKQNTLAKSCDSEMTFIAEFEKLGFIVIPQKAFGPYNIDIAIRNTAIEIHGTACNPHNHAYYSKRVVNLLKGGWNVIYIKTTSNVNVKRAAHQVSKMINLIESDDSAICHYGMIRGSGELIATGCLDRDEFTTINGPNAFFDTIT